MALPASLALIGALLAAPALAQEAPDALVKRVTEEVTQHKDVRSGDPAKLRAVVETKLVPHIDTRRVTQIALGQNWRRATPEQQDRLVREFTMLVVRTYSGALANYRDQAIEVLPLRAAGDTDVTVRSRIRQAGAEAILIEYDLAKTESGWKVYDVRVAGVSLVATYRTTFTEEVRNRGIDGLISTLAAKNRA
ncbi:MAG: ABC transporter substrate-binding protein [Betaproteobacteria bacterium]|nr:ABC transporter substrate-binding protein [Betaproteobacteria bacterium]